MSELLDPQKQKQVLYSPKSIGLATFLGGPLGASYMIKENFDRLEEPDKGNTALIYGLAITVVLMGSVFLMSEKIATSPLMRLLPIAYTGIAYWVVDKYQGDFLKRHKELGLAFFSKWKALGIGIISSAITILTPVAILFFSADNAAYELFQEKMVVFEKNEKEALEVYSHFNRTRFNIVSELDNKSIPKMRENMKLLSEIEAYENLPPDLKERVDLLMTYTSLRIEAFKLIKKVLWESSEYNVNRIDEINKEIDKLMNKLDSTR